MILLKIYLNYFLKNYIFQNYIFDLFSKNVFLKIHKKIYFQKSFRKFMKKIYFCRESNRRAHSRPGSVPFVSERSKHVVREET